MKRISPFPRFLPHGFSGCKSVAIHTCPAHPSIINETKFANAANTTPSSPALIQFFHVLPVEETLCPQKLISIVAYASILVFPLIQSLPDLLCSEPYFHSESEQKDAVNRPLFGSVSAHRNFRSSRRRSGHVRRSTYGCPSLSLYFVNQRFVGGAWQIVPPPTTTSPSYRTTACPTVTALCGASNSSLTRPCCSGYTAAHCSA